MFKHKLFRYEKAYQLIQFSIFEGDWGDLPNNTTVGFSYGRVDDG
jgi:hypothetical protein